MPVVDIHVELEGYAIPGINQNAAQVSQFMQARGIERSIVMSARAAQADPLSGNRILRAMVEQEPGLFACLVAHLNRIDASLQAIRDLMSLRRFVGVALISTNPAEALHPLVADEVLNACRRYQKPVMLFTPNAACVQVGLHLAKTYKMHKFIFLEMGGADWRTAIAAAHQATNIHLEVSGAMDRAKVPAAIEAVGSHRVLFGSGMPGIDPVAVLGLIEDSGISPNDQRRILSENAVRMFNLDENEE